MHHNLLNCLLQPSVQCIGDVSTAHTAQSGPVKDAMMHHISAKIRQKANFSMIAVREDCLIEMSGNNNFIF